MYVDRPTIKTTCLFQNHHVTFTSLTLLSAITEVIFCLRNVHNTLKQLQCGSMPNVMAARPNMDGALCESSVIPFLVPRRKLWLTPAAGVPCSNTANTAERKTWASTVNIGPGKITSAGRSPRKCIHSVPAMETAKHRAKFGWPPVSDVAAVTKARCETS